MLMIVPTGHSGTNGSDTHNYCCASQLLLVARSVQLASCNSLRFTQMSDTILLVHFGLDTEREHGKVGKKYQQVNET